jgi:5'-3' exonuclease
MTLPLVHLVDAHIYIFRSWFGMPEMRAPDGAAVEAVYGFTNTLIRYLRDEEPTHVGVCFDHGLATFRNEKFPAYKQSRGEPPPELEAQFELCQEAARALGLEVFTASGFEADDVIATLVESLGDTARVRVVTADKDLSQLVTEDGRVVLYDLARERLFDAAAVREKFGVGPAQIPDYLGLVGDSVDDLPGVPGVGPKGAAAALSAFGSADAIPAEPDAWEGVPVRGARRLAGRIAEHRDQLLRIRELATVVRDVPGIGARLDDLAWHGADRQWIDELYGRLGWGQMATWLPGWA